LAGKPQKDIDFKKISKNTKDYSGADINAMIDIAVEKILEEAMQTGIPKPISTKVANKSGLYDEILKYLK